MHLFYSEKVSRSSDEAEKFFIFPTSGETKLNLIINFENNKVSVSESILLHPPQAKSLWFSV